MYEARLSITPTNFAVESPSLKLEKPFSVYEKGADADDAKKTAVGSVVDCINTYQKSEFTTRWGDEGDADCFVIEPELGARLIVNMANGMLENAGLCLHRTFGYPYIPGSAVKGVARHAAWVDWDDTEADDKQAKESKALAIAEIFGYPTNEKTLDAYLEPLLADETLSGGVCFFPAEPAEGDVRCEVDILNVHHRDYYGEKRERATDDENPNLCYFPVIKAGQKFRFAMRRKRSLSDANFKLAQKWLKTGLSLFGIGAKTSAGYGWFDIPEDCSDVVTDGEFLSGLESRYVVGGKAKAEAFKKAYKKGEIAVGDDKSKQRAICEFMDRHNIKIGGRWQEEINGWIKSFGGVV